MKNLTKTLVAVCMGAAALTSCQQKSEKPEFAAIDKTETFRAGGNSFELDYRFEYLSWYSVDSVAAKIRTSMIADFFGGEYVDVNPMESTKKFDQSVADEYTKGVSGDYKWSGFIKIRSHHNEINDRIVAYTVERSEYMGGAHGMETIEYANYDLRTGDKLTLDDLFTAEGKAALTGRIHQAILKEHHKDSWEGLDEENCYFAQDEVKPTENFLLSKDYITFVYNPYEIACYAQGRTRVTLPLNGLEGFKPEMMVK